MTQLDTNALFTQYLNVVNRALGEHRDEQPYKLLFDASEKALGDRPVGVAVYKDDPDTPHDWFTVRADDGTFRIVEHGKCDDGVSWRVKEEHLRNVVENPEQFVDQPLKLDLDWLRTRLSSLVG